MGPLSRHRPPTDRLTVVQAVRDGLARSPAFGDAVISDPSVGPGGAVVLDVRIGQETAFRVVAPTEDEAYAVLHELIGSVIDAARKAGGVPAQPSARVSGSKAERCSSGRPAVNPPPDGPAQRTTTSQAPPGPPPATGTFASVRRGQPAFLEGLQPVGDARGLVSRNCGSGEDGMGSVQGFRCGQCRAEIPATTRSGAPYWSVGPDRPVLCCGTPMRPLQLGQLPSLPLPRRRLLRCLRCGYSVWVIVQPVGALVCAGCQAECVAVSADVPAAETEAARSSARTPQAVRALPIGRFSWQAGTPPPQAS